MILFIDTCFYDLVISIVDKDIVFTKTIDIRLSSDIMVIMESVFEGYDVNDLKSIYVVNGPGSFTGIRIGVVIAKVMAMCLDVSLYSVSKLAFMASGYEKCISVIDARRGYVFAGVYDNMKCIYNDCYIKYDEIVNLFPGVQIVDNNDKFDIKKVLPLATKVGYNELVPNYLKNTEAFECLK